MSKSTYILETKRSQSGVRGERINKCVAESLTEAIKNNYIPPCYWSINAFGDKSYKIKDSHPFSDSGSSSKDFQKSVPPLENNLTKNSVMTWCFQLGYARGGNQRYVPITELDHRVNHYQNEIVKGKSIVGILPNNGLRNRHTLRCKPPHIPSRKEYDNVFCFYYLKSYQSLKP